jgi:two-component system copper resistance phosphate regulon response regulator CusR
LTSLPRSIKIALTSAGFVTRHSVSKLRILVAEDDKPLANVVRIGLEAEHYAVDIASDGEEARSLLAEFAYDLIILDLNLQPAGNAEFLRQVRSIRTSLPVIVLTPSNVQDRLKRPGLRAESFLAKPFSISQLSARVGELLRGPAAGRPAVGVLRAGELELNRAAHSVMRAGRRIELSSKEFDLLECLMRHAGRRVSRATIIKNVWHLSPDTVTNVADVYIKYLRKKVDEGFKEKLIRTIRGVGYQLGGKDENAA